MSREQMPRIIYYYQTHLYQGQHVSILPVLQRDTGVTHIIVAAIHINHKDHPSGHISLNDDPYDDPKLEIVWQEVQVLQHSGVKVLGMLGGAAQGSFTKLDGDVEGFEKGYRPLHRMIQYTGLDGLDLDVEEAMSLGGIIRLIVRLKSDFGPDFLITLAPVRTAMVNKQNLSGFDHATLEKGLGQYIAWYNTQFYCGWGDMASTEGFEEIMGHGWPPERIVIGLVTNPGNGPGWVADEPLRKALTALKKKYPKLGGVMGWEYFNSITESQPQEGEPWVWAKFIKATLHADAQELLEEL
jgi:chitinase